MKPLITKLTRPRLIGVVQRKRLFELLDRTYKNKIVWISAPAGSGKTTLVANWLDIRKIRSIWYQADEGDADVATFFSYMRQAVKHAAPKYRKSLPLFTPEYSLGIPTFTKRFFETLYERLGSSHSSRRPTQKVHKFQGSVIVIDNYQDVPLGSQFHEIVRTGLEVAPPGAAIIIISRNDPPAVFARLFSNGLLHLIDWNAVQFTLKETRDLIQFKENKRPDEEEIRTLYKITQGWVAGLVLLSENIIRGRTARDMGGAPRNLIFDYFASELFNLAHPDIQDFLMKTSFLPQMTLRIASDLTGNERSEHIINTISRHNFFIQRHATPEIVYQYHPLFREFLLSHAKQTFSAEEILRIKKKAALLLLSMNQVESALELLVESGDWEDITSLILTNAQSLASQGRFTTLAEWIERIPNFTYKSHPWLFFWLGVSKKTVNPPEARALYERAFDSFHTQGDTVGLLLSWAEIVDSFVYEWNDFHPLDRWITWLDNYVKAVDSFPSQEIEARVASRMVGALTLRRPDHPEIKRWVERAYNLSDRISDVGLRVQAFIHIINYYRWTGHHSTSLTIIDKVKKIVLAPSSPPMMSIINNCLEVGSPWVISADFDKALSNVAEGLERGEKNGIHIWDHILLTFGGFIALHKGEITIADEYRKRLEMTESGQFNNILGQYHIAIWRFYLLGDFVQAGRMAVKAAAIAGEVGMPFLMTLFNIVLVAVYHALGEHRKVDMQLEQARQNVQSCRSLMMEYMCLLIEAYVTSCRGEESRSVELLRKAMILGHNQGYLSMAFWWDPPVMSELCMRALEEGIEIEYVRTLIQKRNLTPPDAGRVSSSRSDSWPWPIKIYTLGRFVIFKDDKQLMFAGRVQQKPLSMLKVIIAFGGKDVSEEQLTDALWPDADGDVAHKSFDTTLHRLRKLLNNDNAIVLQEGRVSLDEKYCWIDTLAFKGALFHAEKAWEEERSQATSVMGTDGSSKAVELTEKAVGIYRGHFLPTDAKEPWAISLRERFRAKFMQCINSLGSCWMEGGRYDKAIQVFMNGLEIDDLAEEFYQYLMVCYNQLGQQAEAVKVYRRCRSVLESSLGLKPSSKTESIYYAIRQGK